MTMERALIVAAHPDDEILGCGGVIAKLAAEKKSVYVVWLTGGILSRHNQKHSSAAAELALIRANALTAMSLLGVGESNLNFLGYEDQKLDTVPFLDLVKSLKQIIQEVKPNCVFTHHSGDYNKDHRVTFEATLYATRASPGEFSPQKLYTYEVLSSTERSFSSFGAFEPNTYIDVSQYIEKKQSALGCYETELKSFPHPRSKEGLQILARHRGMEVGLSCAEAFHLVRSIE